MYETLKKFIEKRGMCPASYHRVENAYRAGKITKDEYEELMGIVMSISTDE